MRSHPGGQLGCRWYGYQVGYFSMFPCPAAPFVFGSTVYNLSISRTNSGGPIMHPQRILRRGLVAVGFVLLVVAWAAARQYGNGDEGQYQILHARYGTAERNVDVTQRLRELARADITFRMGNSTFGVDPDPGRVKTLRIYVRGRNGQERMFEYQEGSVVDGNQFTGWGRGDWGRGEWTGEWGGGSGNRNGDDGQYQILAARYGTRERNVDVTRRLKELARADITFRMGNSTFGEDPDRGRVKTLRIYTRSRDGQNRNVRIPGRQYRRRQSVYRLGSGRLGPWRLDRGLGGWRWHSQPR